MSARSLTAYILNCSPDDDDDEYNIKDFFSKLNITKIY